MQQSIQLGPVTVWPGQLAGKYPDGNQVIVHGSDSIAVFDTPLVAQTLPEASGFASADLVINGTAPIPALVDSLVAAIAERRR